MAKGRLLRPLPSNPSAEGGWSPQDTGGADDTVLGVQQFSNAAKARFGDLLPLPLPVDESFQGEVSHLRSRRAKQRVSKRRVLMDRVRDSVSAINHLAGFVDSTKWPSEPLNLAQREALHRVRGAHFQRAPPPFAESEQAALRQLLCGKASGVYEATDSPGQLASYVRDQLSLPFGQGEPADLAEMLPEREKRFLDGFEEHMLLSPEEIAGEQEKGFDKDMYMDPQIASNPKAYHAFIGDLVRCNLLYVTTTPRSQVGIFMVSKKSGKQRLIIDARRTNRLFREPPTTVLGSVETWSRIEVARGSSSMSSELFVAQEDVKDFFYRLKITRKLGEYFSLPVVDGKLLEKELGYLPEEYAHLQDVSAAPIYPCMKVLPMGFAWSFHLAHEAHCELARRVLPEVPQLRDRFATPVLGSDPMRGHNPTAMLIYADNNNHIGLDRAAVLKDQERVIGVLHSYGLDTHEETEGVSLAESLGVRINGVSGAIQPTAKRDWRLDRSLAALIARPYITGEQLQVIVGHITVRSLLHRGLMGILRHSYTFIEQCYKQKVRLWKSVANEIWLFRALMPLGTADVFAEWDPQPLCTDACLSGYAVMEGDHTSAELAVIGRQDERWRFKLDGGQRRAPREIALEHADPLHDPNTVLPSVDGRVEQTLVSDRNFPEVPHSFMACERWKKVWNSRIWHQEPVHIIEARSVLGAVKHRCRDRRRHGKRILVLNDNMGVILAIQKGRCHNFNLMHIVRRISAHLLATGVRLAVRWVPSELNVADEDSRRWEPARLPKAVHRAAPEESGEVVHQGGGTEGQWASEKPEQIGGSHTEEEEQEPFKNEGGHRQEASGLRAQGGHQVGGREEEESSGETEKIREEAESHPWTWREKFVGNGQCEESTEAGLCEEARAILSFRRSLPAPRLGREGVGRSLVRLCRLPLSGRQWSRCRREVEGGTGVRETRGFPARRPEAPTFSPSHERMAEDGSIADTSSHDRVHQGGNQCGDAGSRLEGNGPIQRSVVFNLCTTRRTDQSSGGRCCEQEQGLRSRCDHPEPLRKTGGQQNGHLRRGVDSGRSENNDMSGAASCRARQRERKEIRGRLPVVGLQLKPIPIPQGVEGVCPELGCRKPGTITLSKSTRRSLSRPPVEIEECASDTKEGALGSRRQRQNLRQARQTAAGDQLGERQVHEVGRGDACAFRNLLPRWESPTTSGTSESSSAEFQGLKFLSLFGGIGNPAKAFCSFGGQSCVIDLSDSPLNDLSKPSRWADIFIQLRWH